MQLFTSAIVLALATFASASPLASAPAALNTTAPVSLNPMHPQILVNGVTLSQEVSIHCIASCAKIMLRAACLVAQGHWFIWWTRSRMCFCGYSN